ncbi:MAG TPA: GNAT family N-acetyltransferase [Actinomycetota bacterium]|nr:GNAT family N-acetyltransferase [Actinomycetota bacterium]
MSITLRNITAEEVEAFLVTCEGAFGHTLRAEELPRLQRIVEPDRSVVAVDDDTMVATSGAYSFTFSIPGGQIAGAGVTMVGVLPTHRRQGILTRMMTEQLADIHQRGEAIAVLWASEASIYQRFGYGLGAWHLDITVQRDRAHWRVPPSGRGRARLVQHEEALKVLPGIYDRVQPTIPGMFARSETWWDTHRLPDDEHMREGGGPMFRAVIEIDGVPEAYALYRIHSEWREGGPAGKLEVVEVLATTPEAYGEAWRYVFGVDLVQTIHTYWEPADSPLQMMLLEPGRLRGTLSDSLWVRIVDVPGALEARSFATNEALVLGIEDPVCPWNEGTWRLTSQGGGAVAERTDAAPDITLGIADLGATYLGGVRWTQLAAARRVVEHTSGALVRADAMFVTPRAPWCPEIF